MATAAGKSNTASTRDSTRADYSSDDPAFEHNALNIPLFRQKYRKKTVLFKIKSCSIKSHVFM